MSSALLGSRSEVVDLFGKIFGDLRWESQMRGVLQ